MEVINPKLNFFFISSLLILQIASPCFGANEQFVKLTHNPNPTFDPFPKIEFSIPNQIETISQTLTYLNQSDLKTNVETTYQNKINYIGANFFENLINNAIAKELELKDSHYVFYHGQMLEFMLFQDIFDNLFRIKLKKNLKDFFILRVPDKDFDQVKKITDFLTYHEKTGKINYKDFDHDTEVRKVLLAVNPSLFGNQKYGRGECSFEYFLNSRNIAEFNFIYLIKNIFDYFDILRIYAKYENKIQELINLLSGYQSNKTGILLQIFVPKNMVEDLTYRCFPFGIPYYFSEKYHLSASTLDGYQKNHLYYCMTSRNIDEMQFRLLINEKMLNPDSGIKMFRYVNETDNVKIYKQELITLFQKIEKELTSKKIKLINKKNKRKK